MAASSNNPFQVSSSCWCFPSSSLNFNAGLIASDGHAWVIDPGMAPAEVDGMQQLVRSRSLRVEAVFLTHHHWDHIMGVGAFGDARVIAHASFKRVWAAKGAQNREWLEGWFHDEKLALPEWDLSPSPTEFFHAQKKYQLGSLEITAIPLAGHTADQAGLYIPAEGTLWAADCLSDLEIPYASFSSAAFMRSMRKLLPLDIQRIVPGHGHPTASASESTARIERDLAYLKALRAGVKQCLRGGMNEEQTVSALLGLDDREGHEWNIKLVCAEMKNS